MTSTARSTLAAAGLHAGYGDREVVHGASVTLRPRRLTAIIGPNGCGKSTLLKVVSRQLAPGAGTVTLDGEDAAELATRAFAQRVGLLPQSPVVPERIAVRELVGRGRDPHRRWYETWSATDSEAVERALALTSLTALADAPVDELSGGQRQRAWIALLLAQRTDVLLLDEPTSFLDVAHQLDVLELLTALAHEDGRTIAVVLHDLSLAARYADTVVAMRDGRIVADGDVVSTMTAETMATVFDVDAGVSRDAVTGRPVVVPRHRIER